MKKSLSKVLRFIVACPLSIIVSYLMWLVFHWLVPYVMQVQTVGKLLLYILVLEPLVISIITVATSLLTGVFSTLINELSNRLKWIFILPFLFHGYSSLMIPWRIAPNGAINVFMAIATSFYAVVCFGAAIYFILGRNDND